MSFPTTTFIFRFPFRALGTLFAFRRLYWLVRNRTFPEESQLHSPKLWNCSLLFPLRQSGLANTKKHCGSLAATNDFHCSIEVHSGTLSMLQLDSNSSPINHPRMGISDEKPCNFDWSPR